MTIAEKIARRTLEMDYTSLDPQVLDQTRCLLLDYLGAAICGSQTESSQMVHRFLSASHAPSRGVPIIGTPLLAEAPYAALANGAASHALEVDDIVNAASLHPAVTIMSASLSAARLAGCSGGELLEGIIAGYELSIKLGIALTPAGQYARGFHPTGTCGALGSALAAAKILNLDTDGLARAVGIAGSQAAGSMEYTSDGSYTKRLHAGWAAHAGLVAALLAREGFTGPASIIEGTNGFLHAYSSVSDPRKVLEGWGKPYEVMKTSIKPHACCRYQQGSIDCILDMAKKHNLGADDIKKVKVAILKAGFPLVAEPRKTRLNPRTVADAQFSMPFGAAVAILFGKVFLDQYSRENIASPKVKGLMEKVVCVQDPDIEKEFPEKWPAKVEIQTHDGRTLQSNIQYPKGDPENPLSLDEIIQKFTSLATSVFTPERSRKIVKCVLTIDEAPNIQPLMELLAAPS